MLMCYRLIKRRQRGQLRNMSHHDMYSDMEMVQDIGDDYMELVSNDS